MKKLTILAICLLATTLSKAQKGDLRPNGQTRPVAPPIAVTDTLYHLKPVDVANRAGAMQQLQYTINYPNDVTPNFRKQVQHIADSLIATDATWFFKVHPELKAKGGRP